MSEALQQVIVYVLFPVVAMALGGGIAAFRPPGARIGSAIQHFAAGMVFAAVAVELLPDIVSLHNAFATIVGFALGTALMLAVRQLTEGREKEDAAETPQPTGLPIGLIATIGVDIFIDGLLIGVGFAAGAKEGILLTVALTLELLSLGLATSASLHRVGASRGRSIAITTGLAILPAISAIIGTTLLAGMRGAVLDGVLAFGVAALLYLVVEELLTEAHEVPETPLITSVFFVGFLSLLVISLSV